MNNLTMVMGALVFAVGAQQPVITRHRTLVTDLKGRPIPNARVRIANGRIVVTDERGMALLDSLPAGRQSLDVTAIGYVPERRTLDVRAGAAGAVLTDTVVLVSLESVLDTARITAAGAVGFDARRFGKAGQFITAADIERENPKNTTSLLRTREGLRYVFDRNGYPSIKATFGNGNCSPLVLVDGFRHGAVPRMPGKADLDWAVHPDEIGRAPCRERVYACV